MEEGLFHSALRIHHSALSCKREDSMKVRVALGTTVKDDEGKVLGTGGEVIEVDDRFGKALVAGGSAEPLDGDRPKRK
jgi:hypothetical protein